jgi:hypothetical protein
MKTLDINNWNNSYKEFNNLFNYIKKKGGSINKIRNTPENLQKVKKNTYKIIKNYNDKKIYQNLDNETIIKNVHNFQINYINLLFIYFTNLFNSYYDKLDYTLKDNNYKIFSIEMTKNDGDTYKYISFLNIKKGNIIRICIKPRILLIEYSKKPLDPFEQIHITIFDKERGFHLTEETTQNHHYLKINELSGLLKNRNKRPIVLEDIKEEVGVSLEKSPPINSRLGLIPSHKKHLEDNSHLVVSSNKSFFELTTKKRRLEEKMDESPIEKIQDLHKESIAATLAMNIAKETYKQVLKTNNQVEIQKTLNKYREKTEYANKLAEMVKNAIKEKEEPPKKSILERLMLKKGGKNDQLYQVDNVDDIYDFYVGIKNILYEIKKISDDSIQGKNLELAIEFLNELGNFIKSVIIDNYDETKDEEIEEIKHLKFDS